MKPEDAQRDRRALEIVARALECPSLEVRARHVQEACGDDALLMARVETLLANHIEDEFLQEPVAGRGGATVVCPIPEQPGDTIGRYKLLEKLGEGGCGVVYMAEQEKPVRRRVALKIIKPGMDSQQVIARFEAERQALALMDHPNIAKIFDGGVIGETSADVSPAPAAPAAATNAVEPNANAPAAPGRRDACPTSGRPYFVMELVRGVRITDYCTQHKLSIRQRLDLFIAICQAVQHAHQKGILHRDLKPSNILVTENDGRPVPKVIDFGIAKATAQKLTDRTVFTQFAQFLGTPAYMSPEQAAMTSLDIDTRSDIYSLGVLLYELLTGTTPFDTKELLKVGFDEMRRVIRETEPERPSTRLTQSRSHSPGTPDRHSALRIPHSAFDRFDRFDRDLDWIVMKCLEKDRNRRYETANGLAADVQRHLSNEPIVARPPSTLYKFQKVVQRNKVLFTAAAVVLATLLAGLTLSTWALLRERVARQQARIEAAKSKQVAAFLKEIIQGVEPSVALGRDVSVLREIADQTYARMGQEQKVPPEIEVQLRATLGEVYHHLGDYKKAETMHRETLARLRQSPGPEHPDLADLLRDFACVLEDRKKYAEAEAVGREALDLDRRRHGPDSPIAAQSLEVIARAVGNQKRFDEAEALLQESLDLNRRLHGPEHASVAGGLRWLAELLDDQGRIEEAEAAFQQALVLMRKTGGRARPEGVSLLSNFADFQWKHRRFRQAEQLYRELLPHQQRLYGEENARVTTTLNNIGASLHALGRYAESEPYLRQVLARRQQLHGSEHLEVAHACFNLGLTLGGLKKFPEAETLLRHCLDLRRKLAPSNISKLEITLLQLGQVLEEQRKYAEAEPLFRELLESRRSRYPAEVEDVIAVTFSLARLLTDWTWAEQQSRPKGERPGPERVARAREGELLMRSCLEARLRNTTVARWKTSLSKSRLGSALVNVAVTDASLGTAEREATLAQAEALLREGHAEVQLSTAVERPYKRVTLELLLRLYTAWNKPAQFAEWQARLEDFERTETAKAAVAVEETPR